MYKRAIFIAAFVLKFIFYVNLKINCSVVLNHIKLILFFENFMISNMYYYIHTK